MDDYQNDVSSQDLQDELNRNNHNVTVTTLGNNLKVLFNDTGHMYTVGQDGQIGELTEEDLKEIVDVGMIDDYTTYYELTNGNVFSLKLTYDSGIINGGIEYDSIITNNGIREKFANGFVDNNGKVYTWGDNENGQVGDGTNEYRALPVCISDIEGNVLHGKNIVLISGNGEITIAIDDDENIYIWGNGINEPTCISNDTNNSLKGRKITQLVCGENGDILALDEEGKLYGIVVNSELEMMVYCANDDNMELKQVKIVDVYDVLNLILLDENGKIYIWDGDTFSCLNDIENSPLMNKTINKLCLVDDILYAIDIDNFLYAIDLEYGDIICITTDDYEDNMLYGINMKDIAQIEYSYNNEGIIGLSTDNKAYILTKSSSICLSDLEDYELFGKKITYVNENIAIDSEGKAYRIQISNGVKIYCLNDNYPFFNGRKVNKIYRYKYINISTRRRLFLYMDDGTLAYVNDNYPE